METSRTNLPQIQKESLEQFVTLLPKAFQKINDMLDDPETPAVVKAHLADVIFERVLGRTEQTFNLIAHESNMEEAAKQMEGIMAKYDREYQESKKLAE